MFFCSSAFFCGICGRFFRRWFSVKSSVSLWLCGKVFWMRGIGEFFVWLRDLFGWRDSCLQVVGGAGGLVWAYGGDDGVIVGDLVGQGVGVARRVGVEGNAWE